MKFIVNDKIYDTDKAEKVLDYRRRFPLELFPQFSTMHDAELYRTAKGNWFSIKHEDFDGKTCIPETDEEVKRVLKCCTNIDLYAKYFGELEEA